MKEYLGIYQGIVTKTDDPEKRGRIKCKIPKVLGNDVESAWCDPVVTVAYDGGGDFCVPFIDEAVWVGFIHGEVNKPIYFGGWWKKEKTPWPSYDRLDDTRIISYKDFKITIHENEATIENCDGDNQIIMNKEGITIKSSTHIQVTAPRIDHN